MRPWIDDLKHAARSLLRDRGVFLASVVCLALGLGTLTVALELVDALLLQPPAGIEDPSNLHRLYLTRQNEGVEKTVPTLPYPAIDALTEANLFQGGLTSYFTSELPMEAGGTLSKAPVLFASRGFFDVLTLTPRWGRPFSATEQDVSKAIPVALLTHSAARRLFGDPAQALGKPLRFGQPTFQVIGVLPEGFRGLDLDKVDVVLPMGAAAVLTLSPGWYESPNAWFLNALVREDESPHGGLETQVGRILEPVLGTRFGLDFGALQAVKRPDSQISSTLIVGLAGVAGVVLLIACLNVASLFLVRHLRRRQEMGVRLAMGAGTRDLWRLVLAESVLVASVAGLLGVGLAAAQGRLLRSWILPETASVSSPDMGMVLTIIVVLVALVTLLCGVLPAMRLRHHDVTDLLDSGGRQATPSGGLEAVLLGVQVAFAMVSVIAVGWFFASLLEIDRLDLGLEPDRVVVAQIDMARGEPANLATTLYETAQARLEAVPGVEQVASAAGVPLRSSFAISVSLPDREAPELETGGPYVNAVSPGFFRTLGTDVLQGRPLTADDEAAGAEPVVVINETMARYFYPGEVPLGHCLGIGEIECARVVGVVENARRSGLREEPTFQLYLPFAQAPEWLGRPRALFARLSEAREAQDLVHQTLVSVAGDRWVETQLLSRYLERDLRPFRLGTSLLTLFASLALALIVLGIYVASARVVTERYREIGVRMALGAKHRTIMSYLGRKILRFLIPGLLVGMGLALALGRFAEPLLFGVSASDPKLFALASILLVSVAGLASLRPTLRALRISPVDALSVE